MSNSRNTDKAARDRIAWGHKILQQYTLEELEAQPELLTMIPEDQRADWLKEQKKLQEQLDEIRALIREKQEQAQEAIRLYNEAAADLDSLWIELEAQAREKYNLSEEEYASLMAAAPELHSMDLKDFRRQSMDDQGGLLIGGLLDTILKRAQEVVQEIQEALEAPGENEAALPAIKYKKHHDLTLSLDKLATVFFNWNAPDPKQNVEGQMSFALDELNPLKYERDGGKEITLFYNYAYDDDVFSRLNLKKKIDDEDYFVLSYLYDAFISGNRLISPSKLYREMNGDDPNETQRTKLVNRLVKLASTTIYINDNEVINAWDKEDENSTYKEIVLPLAPIVIGTERYTASGKVVHSSIKILDAPAVLQIGHTIGQYTTVPKTLLLVKKTDGRKINKTERYYKVLRYLIRETARMRDGTRQTKILYDTFYRETGETKPRGQQLARDLLFTILEHFRREKWISAYKEERTASTGALGVRITVPAYPKKKRLAERK